MSSAAERAEARRKAILAKRGDRLAKLTTSARGEDAAAFIHDDAPSFSRKFLGEETGSDMPTPFRSSVSPSPSSSPAPSKPRVVSDSNTHTVESTSTTKQEQIPSDIDPAVWSPEFQQQFMQALMNAQPSHDQRFPPSSKPSSRVPSGTQQKPSGNDLPPDNPLLSLLAQGSSQGFTPPGAEVKPDVPPSRMKVLLPLIHLLAMWGLLAYFVFWAEPQAYRERVGGLDVGRWSRWAMLGQNENLVELLSTFKVHTVPFFWAFVTLSLGLHSLRIYSGSDDLRQSSMMTVILDLLPPPFPVLIQTVWKYVVMFSVFLDDIAALVFGVGAVIYLAGYATSTANF